MVVHKLMSPTIKEVWTEAGYFEDKAIQIAHVKNIPGDEHNCSNVNLVAAAPELLEACNAALIELKKVYVSNDPVIIQLVDAIAKATEKGMNPRKPKEAA